MVIAVFQGESSACDGYRVESVREDADRVLVRVEASYFQTVGGHVAKTAAWGVFVVPRFAKRVEVELDTRSLIAAPPEWTRVAVLKPGNSVAAE